MKNPSVSRFKIDQAWTGEVSYQSLSALEKKTLRDVDLEYELTKVQFTDLQKTAIKISQENFLSRFKEYISSAKLWVVPGIFAAVSGVTVGLSYLNLPDRDLIVLPKSTAKYSANIPVEALSIRAVWTSRHPKSDSQKSASQKSALLNLTLESENLNSSHVAVFYESPSHDLKRLFPAEGSYSQLVKFTTYSQKTLTWKMPYAYFAAPDDVSGNVIVVLNEAKFALNAPGFKNQKSDFENKFILTKRIIEILKGK